MSVQVREGRDRQSQNGRRNEQGGPPSPFEAVLAHPFITLIPVLLLVGAAVALGLAREPQYTAEARLGVGSLAPGGGDAGGTTEANEQLAATYSRAIDSGEVLRPVSRSLGVPRGDVTSRLSSSAVADSPLFVIEATGDSERDAVRLAQAATQSLTAYVGKLAGSAGSRSSELRRYRDAQVDLSAAKAALADAEGTDAESAAEAEIQTAELRVRALRTAYVERTRTVEGGSPARVVSEADSASSDRMKRLQLFVVAGLLAGLLIGVALATLRAASTRVRSAR